MRCSARTRMDRRIEILGGDGWSPPPAQRLQVGQHAGSAFDRVFVAGCRWGIRRPEKRIGESAAVAWRRPAWSRCRARQGRHHPTGRPNASASTDHGSCPTIAKPFQNGLRDKPLEGFEQSLVSDRGIAAIAGMMGRHAQRYASASRRSMVARTSSERSSRTKSMARCPSSCG